MLKNLKIKRIKSRTIVLRRDSFFSIDKNVQKVKLSYEVMLDNLVKAYNRFLFSIPTKKLTVWELLKAIEDFSTYLSKLPNSPRASLEAMQMKIDKETSSMFQLLMDAYSLLSIMQENRGSSWEEDRNKFLSLFEKKYLIGEKIK